MRALAAAVFAMTLAVSAQAASVRMLGAHSIAIEGEIVQGDYARLLALLERSAGSVDAVHLYSHGGSVFEAIKIGTLIRDLKLRTVAPRRSDAGNNVCTDIDNPRHCTCLSACVLAFAGGIHHTGNVLGVHRSYVSGHYPGTGSDMGEHSAARQLSYTVDDYLQKMGFPAPFIAQMNATRSQQITYLRDTEVRQYLSGYTARFDAQMTAQCGRWQDAPPAGFHSAAERQHYQAQRVTRLRVFLQCQQTAERRQRQQVFARVMTEARKNAANRLKFF